MNIQTFCKSPLLKSHVFQKEVGAAVLVICVKWYKWIGWAVLALRFRFTHRSDSKWMGSEGESEVPNSGLAFTHWTRRWYPLFPVSTLGLGGHEVENVKGFVIGKQRKSIELRVHDRSRKRYSYFVLIVSKLFGIISKNMLLKWFLEIWLFHTSKKLHAHAGMYVGSYRKCVDFHCVSL